MFKYLLRAALFALAIMPNYVFAKCAANCGDRIAVSKGASVPVHRVAYCFIGPADGQHEKVACNDPRAVHLSPAGVPVVCFMGDDGRPAYDYPEVVSEGRKYIAHKVNGLWQPDWR